MTARQAGARKQILNVAQAARPIVQQVFAFARTIETTRNGNSFTRSKLQSEVSTLAPVAMMMLGFWFGFGRSFDILRLNF